VSPAPDRYDVLVVGCGPAGQKAAVQAAKVGRRVLMIERERAIGGECLHRGTIPSKTLRETALYLSGLRRRASGLVDCDLSDGVKVASLMRRLDDVLAGHTEVLRDQMERNGVEIQHGRASFRGPHVLSIQCPGRDERLVQAERILLATGSRPRTPESVGVDHEHVLDSDSVLSMIYLPRSLVILGGGVIACEFASIFAALGVDVTIVDERQRPLALLDPELSAGFVTAFEAGGGRYLSTERVVDCRHDGVAGVVTMLADGTTIRSEKALCALGRVAQTQGLCLEAAGLAVNARGQLEVDAHGRTCVPHVYAAGDIAGPPSLAASAMEQGRRAMCHALGLDAGGAFGLVPVGVYTIPEIATVGLTEAQARAELGGALVGRAPYAETARGQINGYTEGFIKLVADGEGRRVVGAQILGECATELVHVPMMAILGAMPPEVFVENIFNFPTLSEGFRAAGLQILQARAAGARDAA
jgi:NAD(P) transhydrogenase